MAPVMTIKKGIHVMIIVPQKRSASCSIISRITFLILSAPFLPTINASSMPGLFLSLQKRLFPSYPIGRDSANRACEAACEIFHKVKKT